MEYLQWGLAILFIIGGLASIWDIGKPRQPRTAGEVVVGLVMTGLLVYALIG